MKRLERSQRPSSARNITRNRGSENKAPARVEAGFKGLLAQNQMSTCFKKSKKTAPKKAKDTDAERVDKIIHKMRTR